jgi:hypothetical protein
MSVSPISPNAAVQQVNTPAAQQSTAKPANNQSAIPQDKVTLSSASQSKSTVRSGDVDHDGDSK